MGGISRKNHQVIVFETFFVFTGKTRHLSAKACATDATLRIPGSRQTPEKWGNFALSAALETCVALARRLP
jgi:hypothetical protein